VHLIFHREVFRVFCQLSHHLRSGPICFFILVGLYAALALVLEEEIQVGFGRRPSRGLGRDAILDNHSLMAVIERILQTTRGSEVELCAPILVVTGPGVDVIRGNPRAAPIVFLNAHCMPPTEKIPAPLIIPGRLF
jgi:hypothetical protein